MTILIRGSFLFAFLLGGCSMFMQHRVDEKVPYAAYSSGELVFFVVENSIEYRAPFYSHNHYRNVKASRLSLFRIPVEDGRFGRLQLAEDYGVSDSDMSYYYRDFGRRVFNYFNPDKAFSEDDCGKSIVSDDFRSIYCDGFFYVDRRRYAVPDNSVAGWLEPSKVVVRDNRLMIVQCYRSSFSCKGYAGGAGKLPLFVYDGDQGFQVEVPMPPCDASFSVLDVYARGNDYSVLSLCEDYDSDRYVVSVSSAHGGYESYLGML